MLDFALLALIRNDIKMHKWVLVTHCGCGTSNFSMEVLENTENDLQIDHWLIVNYVMVLANHIEKSSV